jgi:hypothetical protein
MRGGEPDMDLVAVRDGDIPTKCNASEVRRGRAYVLHSLSVRAEFGVMYGSLEVDMVQDRPLSEVYE